MGRPRLRSSPICRPSVSILQSFPGSLDYGLSAKFGHWAALVEDGKAGRRDEPDCFSPSLSALAGLLRRWRRRPLVPAASHQTLPPSEVPAPSVAAWLLGFEACVPPAQRWKWLPALGCLPSSIYATNSLDDYSLFRIPDIVSLTNTGSHEGF